MARSLERGWEEGGVGIQFGGPPDAFAKRIEELHHRYVVDIAIMPIGKQAVAQIVGHSRRG